MQQNAAPPPTSLDELAFLKDPFVLPHTTWTRRIDAFFQAFSRAISWIWLVLLIVIMTNVLMRYAFGQGRIEFEELQWHLYAIGFLLGLSTVLQSDEHVRVDLFRERFSDRTKAWIDLIGIIILLIPFILLVLYFAVPFWTYSFVGNEASQSPGGLPYRWFLKAFMLIGFGLLLLATLSRLTRLSAYLFGFPKAQATDSGKEQV